jgi:hypothetical protein
MTSFSDGIKKFDDFYNDLKRPTISKFAHNNKINDAKNYLIDHYSNMNPEISFVDSSGQIYDCIPFEQQAGLRGVADKSVPIAPDLPTVDGEQHSKESKSNATQELGEKNKDKFNNQMLAPAGTIPIRRITLDEIMRYKSLDDFISGGKNKPLVGYDTNNNGGYHRYATALAIVENYGMSIKASVNKNQVIYNGSTNNSPSQIFSLQQLWVTNSDNVALATQTVEVIICVNPEVFPDVYDPVLAVYSTNNGYNLNSGGWNLNGGYFVQTNPNWILGGKIFPFCVNGGNQYYLSMAAHFDVAGAKWWVYFGGDTSTDAIGYYPVSHFSGVTSAGLASRASRLDWGGETVTTSAEPAVFPSMGSGNYANTGWRQSAYMRDIKYYPITGGASMVTTGGLFYKNGYTSTSQRYSAPWNETLWYGGPGGS